MQNKDKAARVNSITYVGKDDPPFLIVHGDKDPTVPINQSQLLFEALKKSEVSAHFHTIHGAGHGGPGFAGKNIDEMVGMFFDQKLKGGDTKIEALTTESTADAAMTARDPRQGMPTAGARRGIPWEVIAGRDDKNKDGKVSKEEFSGPALIFQRLDKNGDGVLIREEHEGVQAAPQTPTPAVSKPTAAMKGFQLDGEHWTYRDGDFAMDGIFMKPEGKGPFPGVLISHGMGGNAQSFGMMKAREMVSWGMVCIAPNYTHAGTAEGDRAKFGASDENIRRARNCLDILRSMPEVDGSRLAAYGHSMGGFVTIGLAAAVPDALKAAAITGSGISPQAGYAAPSTDAASKIRAPFLMLHGGNDTTVRPEQSASLKQVLDKNKVPNDRLVADGQGHPIDQTMRDEVFKLIREWFVKNGLLKL